MLRIKTTWTPRGRACGTSRAPWVNPARSQVASRRNRTPRSAPFSRNSSRASSRPPPAAACPPPRGARTTGTPREASGMGSRTTPAGDSTAVRLYALCVTGTGTVSIHSRRTLSARTGALECTLANLRATPRLPRQAVPVATEVGCSRPSAEPTLSASDSRAIALTCRVHRKCANVPGSARRR